MRSEAGESKSVGIQKSAHGPRQRSRARFLLPFRLDSGGLFDGDASAVVATLTAYGVIEVP